MRKIGWIVAAASVMSAGGTALYANDLDPRFDASRATYNPIYAAACAGDRDAFSELSAAAWDGADPVAQYLLGVALLNGENCDVPQPMDPDFEIRAAMEASAGALYPPGMFSHGLNLLSGQNGVGADISAGMRLLEEAEEEGSSRAAEYLAYTFLDGSHQQQVALTRARRHMERAERLGLPADRVRALAEEIAAAEADRSTAAAEPPTQPAPATGGDDGAESGDVLYMFETRVITTDDFPELGPIPSMLGPGFAMRVVYVAQLFDVGRTGCWAPTRVFVMGTRVSIADPTLANPRTFPSMLDGTRHFIEQQDYRGGLWFEDFNEGVAFREAHIEHVGSNLSELVLTLAEAQRAGPECDPSQPLLYPAPVYDRN